MFFEEPKVEFVEVGLSDVITESEGAQIDICKGASNDDDCTYPNAFNY